MNKNVIAGALIPKCTSVDTKTREQFSIKGSLAAKKCKHYKCRPITGDEDIAVIKSDGKQNKQLDLVTALDVLVGGDCKFILHSTKTNGDFTYRIEKKAMQDGKGFIYFVSVEVDGKFNYAGNMTLSITDKNFSYRRGKNGTLEANDLKIKSLLYVLNNLSHEMYDMKLEIYQIN